MVIDNKRLSNMLFYIVTGSHQFSSLISSST